MPKGGFEDDDEDIPGGMDSAAVNQNLPPSPSNNKQKVENTAAARGKTEPKSDGQTSSDTNITHKQNTVIGKQEVKTIPGSQTVKDIFTAALTDYQIAARNAILAEKSVEEIIQLWNDDGVYAYYAEDEGVSSTSADMVRVKDLDLVSGYAATKTVVYTEVVTTEEVKYDIATDNGIRTQAVIDWSRDM